MIPVTERPRTVEPKAAAFTAAILLFGAWMAWFNLSGVWQARRWSDWKQVKGTVISGSSRGSRDNRRTSCTYTYTVDGTPYTNDVVTLMSGSGFQGGGVEGNPVTVYYDPASPRSSALGAGNPVHSWCWGLVGLAIAAFGAVAFLIVLFPGRLPRFISAEDPHDPGAPAD